MSDMEIDNRPEHETRLLDGWFSREELARELGVSVDTLARWETRRIGPPNVRVGRRVIYRRAAVLAWLEAQERRPVK
ncbi:helix-turn-helix transcriptional regulator [Jhaorihella thermophila]|uniref:Helix-turn-helix domain-containing protein n=1 Tax=Jhaorihella thermophila TaxID=488547 RepID=A0A1H5ZB38_9RHOB|nr:helix-turn-helix domain-containing protein [Jhaorihella thermophila]SEG33240.1 Helix-turn-helix domain-containing protein [Jhaorihella thermophila]